MRPAILGMMALAACGRSTDPTDATPTPIPTPVPFDTVVPRDPVTRTLDPLVGDDLDLLFVIQDNCCIEDEMTALGAELGPLVEALGALGSVHIGVITTDASNPARSGRLLAPGPDDPRYLSTPSPASTLARYLLVGRVGSVDEKGRKPVEQALTEPNRTGFNVGFRRGGADLALVFAADENDSSGSDPSKPEFFGFLGLEAQGGRITAHALVGPEGGCATADPGTEYLAVVDRFTGAAGSICDDTAYGAFVADLARILTPVHDRVPLDDRPLEDTVSISFELDRQVFQVIPVGTDCPGGGCTTWRVAGPPQRLVFEPPIPGRAEVTIRYQPQ